MKLKVCGMKHNMAEVAKLQPDYLGFIFYEKSPRGLDDSYLEEFKKFPEYSEITKVGVFVNASIEFIMKKVSAYNLSVIQLHGEDSAQFVEKLKFYIKNSSENARSLEIWKVFSIKNNFNFDVLKAYEPFVDAFLFDTKGPEKGGNGYTFNWKALKGYPSETPIILSGGIGIEHVEPLQQLFETKLPIKAIDVNSKFEIKPGLKDTNLLEVFMVKLNKK